MNHASPARGNLNSNHCTILGAGAIGLSIADELSRRGRGVTLIDRGEPGRETSWAGAGILPPAPSRGVLDPVDRLRRLAMELHPAWADRLREETGVDTGFRRCGGLYAAQTMGEKAALIGFRDLCRDQGIDANWLTPPEAAELEPAIDAASLQAALELPGEWQLRNPRHLKALIAACQARGVQIVRGEEVHAIEPEGETGWKMISSGGERFSETVCVTTGAWSQRLLASCGVSASVFPVRGQIVLYRCERPLFRRVLNVGPRYLVPREDGLILAGSTEEEVGFDKRNTEEGIAELKAFAESLVPALRAAPVERTWAGLRPASFDSLPYIGEAPGRPGLFVACGHFRSGLYLSPATAVLMADLICGQTPSIDLWPFRLSRG